MSAVIKGRAVIWSVGGITFNGTIDSTTAASFAQSLRFSRTSDKAEIKDDGGIIKTVVFSGFKKSLSITVIPAAITGTNTIANAVLSSTAHMPTPSTKITIVDASGTLTDATSWNLISVTQNRSVDSPASIDMELENGDESLDLSDAVS